MDMTNITDQFMQQMLGTTRNYTVVILKAGPHFESPDSNNILWEHGRRNFSLRASGLLSIVCPVRDQSDVKGIGIFNADAGETRQIMEEDPAVKEGILIFEIHPVKSFPGDSLP
jgi:hypothetical protein